jgi:hypothetical protein
VTLVVVYSQDKSSKSIKPVAFTRGDAEPLYKESSQSATVLRYRLQLPGTGVFKAARSLDIKGASDLMWGYADTTYPSKHDAAKTLVGASWAASPTPPTPTPPSPTPGGPPGGGFDQGRRRLAHSKVRDMITIMVDLINVP